MDVKIIKGCGFCAGLVGALKKARDARDKDGAVSVFGKLMHNDLFIAELEKEGIKTIDDPKKATTKTIIMRPHGARPDVFDKIKRSGMDMIDATCPFVKKVQDTGIEYHKKGYKIAIIGKKAHPEVDGILGHVDDSFAIKSPDEITGYVRFKKLCVISQTTTLQKNFDACVAKLKPLVGDLVVKDTICPAAKNRQKDTEELAKEADVMVIIGGKNSSNTRHLFEAAEKHCEAYHIESKEELKTDWFKGKKLCGIAAGASTPIEKVDEVVDAINGL
ncbi:4-hydroxy-3-methylbut-2-enyl diphosphate reductase [Candidatus Woesearchaeota archaeon CG11_big_fil_rev_8_21_14_0_20_43_8]|nr:MAG: 4-hydroxy-3-methylbut-2-enyl diphosphate reductase [Candidatus Woesearchaeota archaeon CG11_big_fil_rev_8_21_14_0_20_43_8]